jgi:hypothetical protein
MKYSHWQLHTSEKDTSSVISRAGKNMGVEPIDVEYTLDKEHGNLIAFSIRHETEEWSEFIYQILLYAESIGFGWTLTGYINQNPEASTSHAENRNFKRPFGVEGEVPNGHR